jgi:hypothetical protein
MNGLSRLPAEGFDWMVEPILNKDTRLSLVANAAAGMLLVLGWEVGGAAVEAATEILSYREPAAHPSQAAGNGTSPLTWGTARV